MRIAIKNLTTKSGVSLEIPTPGVLCVVGGNNVGKSQLLRDVIVWFQGFPEQAVVLDALECSFDLPAEEAEDWFRSNSVTQAPRGAPEQLTSLGGGNQLSMPQILGMLSDPFNNRRWLWSWFVRTLDAAQRVGVAIANMSPPGMGPGGSPLHVLFRDGDLEAQLSEISEKTFGFPLTLDRANPDVRLRVGSPAVASPPLQHPTRAYADAVVTLPSLADQGDGVKNYLGMVLHIMTGSETITVIDEPEAFLHPAQARALGRHLGIQALARDRQLLTATHDRDFVLGLLETSCPVTFLRLNRVGEAASGATLDSKEVKAIWDKPLLRYSNVLQGLFHRAVVVCESDADCRWYGAVLEQMGQKAGLPAEEVLFVPAGGKSQIPVCLRALLAMDVVSFAIVDFDGLLDIEFLDEVLKALKIDPKGAAASAHSIGKAIDTQELRARAKSNGLEGLPAGDITKRASELVENLKQHRILVVREGELESFDRSIGGHGSTWVSGALTANRHRATPEAEALLGPVLAALRVG